MSVITSKIIANDNDSNKTLNKTKSIFCKVHLPKTSKNFIDNLLDDIKHDNAFPMQLHAMLSPYDAS